MGAHSAVELIQEQNDHPCLGSKARTERTANEAERCQGSAVGDKVGQGIHR